jgi:6-phosphogluconate dehydrogenase
MSRFGVIGLGTMGRNLLLNIAEKGFHGVGYDPDVNQRVLLGNESLSETISIAADLASFVGRLERPRRILILVPASKVTEVIDSLIDLLEPGDIIVDCGNSFFKDSEARAQSLADRGIGFLGVGVSGGEYGARHGASVMIGGRTEHYETVKELLEGAAATIDDYKCCARMGDSGAGHFVKMVHNGIEYALMQSIADAYALLRDLCGLSNREAAEVFEEWNNGSLQSFLVEITAGILRKSDSETEYDLIDLVSDVAGQKGTGMWTSTTAMEFGVPIPSIDSAVAMRQISSQRDVRSRLVRKIASQRESIANPEQSVRDLESLLTVSFISAFAQGFSLIRKVSEEKSYSIDSRSVATVWKGGCIIRAAMLSQIVEAFEQKVEHLLEDSHLSSVLDSKVVGARSVLAQAIASGHPCMTLGASLGYVEAFRAERLSTNLIQAQRDHFGAHTYERVDREGKFHTEDWID